ncbi:MAG TPA: Type 1 glutamine amidotransferase-like domain-containing protein [Bacteriovoracaceae bacterium]|nr:Type 1 glutamine amidotransferase-like domain-containing protein [Bacteriovoracaceae bacterium]
MKLVFFSGGDDQANLSLDKSFIELIGKKNPVVTFIPSSSYLSEQEFRTFVRHYCKYKITRFIHFPVDVPFDRILFQEVMRSDAIHMAGGNTFYFLNSLRKAKLFPQLRTFVEQGGVLTGLSAGAILMTENIEMAAYPEFDRDENVVNLTNLSALNLVDFLFFPHFKNSSRYDAAFKKYTKSNSKIIYACPDGAGIVVNNGELRFVGRCFAYSAGHKFTIN